MTNQNDGQRGDDGHEQGAEASPEVVLEAVAEVRREATKAATTHAAVDAMLVVVLLNAVSSLFLGGQSGGTVLSVPNPVRSVADSAGLFLPAEITVTAFALGALVLAPVIFVADAFLRYRRYGIETFERHNPEVEEALRTARDAATDGADNPAAGELYARVLDRLGETSSQGFIDGRQIVGVVVVAAVASVAVVGAAGAGIQVGVPTNTTVVLDDEREASAVSAGGKDSDRDPLGEEGDVDRGFEEQTVAIEGNESEGGTATGQYDGGQFDVSPEDVDTSFAEFAEEDTPEDAELVREYNELLRGLDNETGDSS